MKLVTINKIIFLLALTTFQFSCSTKKIEQTNEQLDTTSNVVELTAEQFKTADIKLASIEKRSLSGALKVNGKLDVPPQNLVSVSAPFGGFLQHTEMLQGKQVHKGELIAVMQNSEYIQLQQDYLDNKSQLEFLETEFKRQEELSKENINAQKSLQQAKASYLSKSAIVEGLHVRLKMLNIDFNKLAKGEITSTVNLYSPINGFVTEVNFNIGSFVNPTDILFKIVDTSHLHAELTVFEKDVTKIKKGQKIRFTLAGEGEERIATVYLIGREIAADRTVRIHGHLDKEEHDMLPGMYLSAFIETGDNMVNALPEKAIIDFETKKYIFTADADKKLAFTMVEVKTGLSEQGYTEVIFPEDINASTIQVVVNGAYSLLSKMKNSGEEE
jgi:cobalt-zinc-cadmium efflux system membrane fusion protein